MPHQAMIFQQLRTFRFGIRVAPLRRGGLHLERVHVYLGTALGIALAFAMPAPSQTNQAPARTGTIMGTATDVNEDGIPDATVVLKEVDSNDPRTIVTTENGLFEFHDVRPGIPYQLIISAKGFADWTSPPMTLSPDQFKL
jgi:Carboxypeptidase regulatory-like domain